MVRFEYTYAPGDYGFIDRSPLKTSAAERLAMEGYSKLVPKIHGFYHVLSARNEYLNVQQECVKTSVSIDRVTWVTQEGNIPN